MTDQFRSTYTQIDLNAIRHNIGVFRSETRSPFIAVVKADAYGHGLVEVARTALEEGASMLAVAVPEEGAALRGDQSVRADIIPAEGGMYNTVLKVLEKGSPVMEIRFQVPDKSLAEEICRNWQAKNEKIYNSLIENLF